MGKGSLNAWKRRKGMNDEKTLEIVKRGSWFHREYHVCTTSGEKLYSIYDESKDGKSFLLLKDAQANEIGSVSAGNYGISLAYHAKFGDEEDRIGIGMNRWKKSFDFPKFGLKMAQKGMSEKFDLFMDTGSCIGKVCHKANKYILSLDAPGKLLPALFLFMTMKGSDLLQDRI